MIYSKTHFNYQVMYFLQDSLKQIGHEDLLQVPRTYCAHTFVLFVRSRTDSYAQVIGVKVPLRLEAPDQYNERTSFIEGVIRSYVANPDSASPSKLILMPRVFFSRAYNQSNCGKRDKCDHLIEDLHGMDIFDYFVCFFNRKIKKEFEPMSRFNNVYAVREFDSLPDGDLPF